MPQPKYKIRRSHTRSRRASNFYARAEKVSLSKCPRCHSLKASHYACPSCGHYDGELIRPVKSKEKVEEE